MQRVLNGAAESPSNTILTFFSVQATIAGPDAVAATDQALQDHFAVLAVDGAG